MSDPQNNEVALAAEEYLRHNLKHVIALYRRNESYGGTLTVSSDAAREYLPGYSTPADRTANTIALGPASSKLAAAIWNEAIAEGPRERRYVVEFITGSPGSGKTSSTLGAAESNIAISTEGMMDNFPVSAARIQQAINAGFVPTLRLVYANDPRVTLRRAVSRAMVHGRPVAVSQMGRLYVEIPQAVAKLVHHFGRALGIGVQGNSLNGALPIETSLDDALRATSAYTIEEATEAMCDELDKLRNAGRISHQLYLRFRDGHKADDSATGGGTGQPAGSAKHGGTSSEDEARRTSPGAIKLSPLARTMSDVSKWAASFALIFLAALPLPAQSPYPTSADHPTPAWFVDVAAKAGITVRDVNGSATNKQYIVEATGSGVAIIDYDRDGWPDIFLVNGSELHPASKEAEAPTNHLFHNNHDGTFTDVTAKSGMASSGWGQGACVGDYDNDGFDDLYVTGYGHNRLFHNQGNGTFREVAGQSGVAGSGEEWGTGCAFIDYDRDGKLDLMVADYVHFDLAKVPMPGKEAGCTWKGTPVMCGPRGLPSAPSVLFHNEGGGHFTDVSTASGIQKTLGHYCFSVTTLDYNEDSWPDIYVACDSTPSILYRNNHDGTFTDVGADTGAAFNEDGREQAGMGSTAADYDGDGHIDIFKTNFSDDTSTLYHAVGDGTFSDVTFPAGLGVNLDALGWGAMFADVDNDGNPDLLVVNGHVYPQVDDAKLGSTFKQPRFLYWNPGNWSQPGTKFKDLSGTSGPGLTQPLSGRGLAIADLWNDGRLSAVVNNLSDLPMLLANEAKNPNHWLGLKLTGTKSNRSAIGTRVTLQGSKRIWVDEVRSGSSYNSSSDLRLHFGLGTETKISSIEVRWPNGQREQFTLEGVDRIGEVVEGRGKPLP